MADANRWRRQFPNGFLIFPSECTDTCVISFADTIIFPFCGDDDCGIENSLIVDKKHIFNIYYEMVGYVPKISQVQMLKKYVGVLNGILSAQNKSSFKWALQSELTNFSGIFSAVLAYRGVVWCFFPRSDLELWRLFSLWLFNGNSIQYTHFSVNILISEQDRFKVFVQKKKNNKKNSIETDWMSKENDWNGIDHAIKCNFQLNGFFFVCFSISRFVI